MFKIKNLFNILIVAILIIIGSIFFGYRKAMTPMQYIKSYAGCNNPDVNAASQIVFLGDSITASQDWNVLLDVTKIKNAGISGDTTDEILVRLKYALSAKPKKIFIMMGINDLLNGQDVAYVLSNYEEILRQIKIDSPATQIYLQSMLPINNDVLKSETADSQEIVELNDQLKILAEKNGAIFVNLYPHFCGADNKLYRKYSWDGLHPNSHGYAVWKGLIEQYIK